MPQPPKKKICVKKRRSQKRDRDKTRREAETSSETELRQQQDRERQERRRGAETFVETESRLQQNRERNQIRREAETSAERESRLQQKRECEKKRQEEETSAETESRLQEIREREKKRREAETSAETESRLQQNRERDQIRREEETSAETESRLQQKREREKRRREEETSVETESRLTEDSERKKRRRGAETSAETESRLQQNRERDQIRRSVESTSERQARVQRVVTSRIRTYRSLENAAFNYDPSLDYASNRSCLIGSMSLICKHCDAKKWKGETLGMCCSGGKVQIMKLRDPPETLHNLLMNNSIEAKHFQKNIRRYNSCFQMTSFGTTKEIREPGYMPTFKVQGQVYHRIGSLQAQPNEDPKFLQVYFVGDSAQQAEQRCRNVPQTRQEIVLKLQEMLNRENSYVHSFKSAMEKICPEFKVVIFADKTPQGEHERRFNAPAATEVAVILAGEKHGARDIILEERSGTLKRIPDTHRSYDALQYPLLFWQGEDGYHFELRQRNPATGKLETKKISSMDFYAYRIMMRSSSFNILLRSKDLFQQFIVDMYAKIESERLRYIQLNQIKLRAEQYIHLRDAVIKDGNVSDVGKLVILPSTFTGSPRYMHERTQDAMTYVRNYGRPDLFLTFTCNPKWEEIQQELFTGQVPQDRHDLLARVFHQKHKTLMSLIIKANIFGEVRCDMYTIEWQKRGLPHAHILIWLRDTLHVHKVDDFISAEIPDPEKDPKLFTTITKHMVHGPCGNLNPRSPCMKNGNCTKRYPRRFLKATQTGQDGYPLYRRRSPQDGGFTANINIRGTEVSVNNMWIVPYCPFLSKVLNAHINVEFCNSVKSIKYVCKYVNKGSDMAVFDVTGGDNELNEIHQYEIGRYINSNEAVWRILGFPIHERHPTVTQLSVHLENYQRVYFTTANAAEQAQAPQETTLTSFFRLCIQDYFARTLLYNQVPKYYTWNNKSWNRRRQGQVVPEHAGIRSSEALGRVYTVHPNNSECFHLRMLLHEVRGPTSFVDLKTVDGKVCESFKEACQLRGLLENDDHWNQALEEAAASRSPKVMRNLFAVMLHMCAMSSPEQLWMNHRESLSEDIRHQARIKQQNMDLYYNDDIFNRALIYIEDRIISLGGSDIKSFGLPQTIRNSESILPNEVHTETNYDTELLTRYIEENESKMVQDQKEAFHKVTRAIFDRRGGIFFLDAPGGTGKTFLINLILAKVRQRNWIALAVASSGIAATLLTGGRTAHSAFKLPLNLASVENPTCNIKRNSAKAKVLRDCKLIVWDECTMSHKAAFEALDVTLKDLRGNNDIMGGVTLLLAGDFRQTLPVIPRGTRADEMQACIKSSYIWNGIERLRLSTNMRVHLTGDSLAQQFANNLLQLGNGAVTSDVQDGCIAMQSIGRVVKTQQQLKEAVFPDVAKHFNDHMWLCQRAILAPTNEAVNVINNQLLRELPGVLQIYKSIDTTCETDEAVKYGTEFLNTLEPPGVPSHILELKIGAPIMLLRNLNPPSLCNGTRLSIKNLMPNIIEATIMTGHATGEEVFISRIPIIPSDLPFQFKRLQFPVRLSFAMSINKAQGQSLKVVGLDLRKPCFSHGQLYVGCSRVGNAHNLHILAPNGRTQNIVYPEALTGRETDGKDNVEEGIGINENCTANLHVLAANGKTENMFNPEALLRGEIKILFAGKNNFEQAKGTNENFAVRDLTSNEMKVLLDPKGYLEDSHMDLFGKIVNVSSCFNMQSVLYVQIPNNIKPIKPGKPNVQILYSGLQGSSVGHWICTHHDGINNHVYDSLNTGFLEEDHKIYLSKLYGPQVRNVFHIVQRQKNSYDCGVYAMAFAVSICLGKDPQNEIYVEEEMRNHAATIFSKKLLSAFPTFQERSGNLS